ncbi:MAG: periplasmic protein TonB [Blastocatellia bacterium]|jgi:protein TonB|nr:periplasmic protein TonB [Blastocatellia bacterium]
MFNNLVESNLHIADMKRRGSFLLATTLAYALLLMAAGVGSIYAYEARVDNQNLELTALVTMLPATAAAPLKRTPEQSSVRRQTRSAVPTNSAAQVPMRTALKSDVTDMRNVPAAISATGDNIPPAPPGAILGPANYDVGSHNNGQGNSPYGVDRGTTNVSSGGNGSELTKDTPPEIHKAEVAPPKPKVYSLGVIESKVIQKGVPPYPELAKRAHVYGIVTVQILLDEQGRVISAHATNGHPLLTGAAERAASQTRFSPTYLSNQPVKVTGIITFRFVLN